MKPAMMDLGLWTEKMVSTVREICNKKQKICMAFSLLFFDPMAVPEKQWNFSNHIAEDPHQEEPPEEEKERIEKAFIFIQEGVKRIMEGEFDKIETFH